MKSVDNVGVDFVNTVLGSGHMNGVINLQLGVCQFSISDDGKTVENDMRVAVRLRMDILCAQRMRDQLDSVIAAALKAAEPAAAPEPEESGVVKAEPDARLN